MLIRNNVEQWKILHRLEIKGKILYRKLDKNHKTKFENVYKQAISLASLQYSNASDKRPFSIVTHNTKVHVLRSHNWKHLY